jgi:hypothetical protein
MAETETKITELTLFRFDPSKITKELQQEGRTQVRLNRRLVARRAVSGVNDYPGKQSGQLQKTIRAKLFRNKLGVVITHVMPRNQVRYPFILVAGSDKNNLAPRKDYINETFVQRRHHVLAALQQASQSAFTDEKVR